MAVFDVCLELPSNGKKVFGFAIDEFSIIYYETGMYTTPGKLVVYSASQKLSQNLDENSQ